MIFFFFFLISLPVLQFWVYDSSKAVSADLTLNRDTLWALKSFELRLSFLPLLPMSGWTAVSFVRPLKCCKVGHCNMLHKPFWRCFCFVPKNSLPHILPRRVRLHIQSKQMCLLTKELTLKKSWRWVGYIFTGFICCPLKPHSGRPRISAEGKGRQRPWRTCGERKCRQNRCECGNKWAHGLGSFFMSLFGRLS